MATGRGTDFATVVWFSHRLQCDLILLGCKRLSSFALNRRLNSNLMGLLLSISVDEPEPTFLIALSFCVCIGRDGRGFYKVPLLR